METLPSLREEIDLLDGELARLFEKRMALAKKIGAVKAQEGLAVRDSAREEEILRQGEAQVSEPLRPYYVRFLRELLALSRAYQEESR